MLLGLTARQACQGQGMKLSQRIPFMLGAEVVIEGFVGLHNSVPNWRQLSDDVRHNPEQAAGHGAC